mmetsp:Transcript_5036/g.14532  ORF Transcript_5036/g.14532 Transcript_5036/m.14532 type:complete len:200 (+) Transcript_5036:3682-4281(+)
MPTSATTAAPTVPSSGSLRESRSACSSAPRTASHASLSARSAGGNGESLAHTAGSSSGSHTRSASSTAGSSVSGGRSPSSARRAPPSRLQSPRPRKSTAQSDEDDEDEARPSHSVHISRPPCFVVRAAPSLHASFSSCRSTGSAAARRASSPSRSARAATPSETFASVRRPSPLLPHSSLSCACPASSHALSCSLATRL